MNRLPMDQQFFFDADEELVLLKKKIIHKLGRLLHRFEPFFRSAHKSKKYNACRKVPLDTYTIDAILFILTSRSFFDNYEEYASIMPKVIRSNYNLRNDPTRRLMSDLEDLFHQEEIIISFSNKMRQRKDGMLRTHQFQRVMDLYRRHLTPATTRRRTWVRFLPRSS